MNDTQTHFVAVCPHCSTALRIRRVFAGQQVQCKHCEKTFVAEDAESPGTAGSVDGGASPSAPTSAQSERIVVTCPTCQTNLSVRRVYIGQQVRCKQCDETFLVTDPPARVMPTLGSRADRPETDVSYEALQVEISRRNQELQASRNQLQAEIDRAKSVQANLDRLMVENQELESRARSAPGRRQPACFRVPSDPRRA